MYDICLKFLAFLCYSVLGWVCETIWCSIGSRKFVNRGFLNGPVCPIYGVGALLVLYLLRPYTENPFTVFLAGIVLTSTLEYLTGVLLEQLFHLRLWDYSHNFCNLNGRVCLRNSLLFGAMAVLLVWGIDPALDLLLSLLPPWAAITSAWSLACVLAADLVLTVRTVLRLNGKLEQLQLLWDELPERLEETAQDVRRELSERVSRRREQHEAFRFLLQEDLSGLEDANRAALLRERKERLHVLLSHRVRLEQRFLRAFPRMTSLRHGALLERLRTEWEKHHK